MKRSAFFLCLLLLFFSCKKESDNNNTGGTTSTKKLVKQEFKSGQETGSFTYTYDAGGRLASLRQESSGSTVQQGFSVYRNAAGMIQKLNFVEDGSRGDTITIVVTSSGNQYTKAVETINRNGMTFSTTYEFTYDNAGHIAQTRTVRDFGGAPDPPSYDEFTYQNNNLVAAKTYDMNNGTKTLVYQQVFEYDNKTNPLAFGNEWLLYSLTFTDFFSLASANNVTKETYKQQGSSDDVVNISYTYDQGLPKTATASSPGGGSSTATFIYQ